MLLMYSPAASSPHLKKVTLTLSHGLRNAGSHSDSHSEILCHYSSQSSALCGKSISLLLIQILFPGKIIFFSEGLLFIHSQYGSITLSKDHINNIKFYDPVWALIIRLREKLFCVIIKYHDSLLAYGVERVLTAWVWFVCPPPTRTPAPWLLCLWSMTAVCSHTSRSLCTAPTSVWSSLFSPDRRATGPSTPRSELI